MLLPSGMRTRRLRPPPRGGFTLVELLVVIGIIGVLVAVLVPAAMAMRAKARATHCQSNIRQLAQGVYLYAAEFKGKFPPNITSPAPGQLWHDDLRVGNYIPQPSPTSPPAPQSTVWACPEDPDVRRSYAMNVWASSKVDGYLLKPPLNNGHGVLWGPHAKSSSKLMLLVEAWSAYGSPKLGWYASPHVGAGPPDPGQRFGGGGGIAPPITYGRFQLVNCELAYANHRKVNAPGVKTQPRGRISVAFGDSHVEMLSSDDIVNYQTGELTGAAYWSPADYR